MPLFPRKQNHYLSKCSAYGTTVKIFHNTIVCLKERRLPYRFKNAIKSFRNLVKYGSSDMFKHIFIDTITACNRRCYYCPNSSSERGLMKNMSRMDAKLYQKIIDQLAAMGWDGEVAPNFYGEPLIDDRMADLVKYTRNKLPSSKILLYTNGDFLTLDLYISLISAGVNAFIVTCHPDVTPRFVEDILDYRRNESNDEVEFIYQKLSGITNRGGLVDVEQECHRKVCDEATMKVGVQWDGNIILCCNDYFVTTQLGNVNTENLFSIWNKSEYKQLRRDLRIGVFKLEICKNCKYGIIPMLDTASLLPAAKTISEAISS